MKLDRFLKSTLPVWREILIGFVSTVLGIAVTIGVNKKLEDNQAEEDKRNLTIMIIHDLDESEQQMQGLVDFYRSYYEKAEYVSKHLDRIAEISDDTLSGAMNFLSISMELSRVKFAQMAENILTTNMSNWTTLNNVKFMSNAEYCFASRKRFNEMIVEKDISEPVQKLFRDFHNKYLAGGMDMDEIRKAVSEYYNTDEVRLYISNFKWALDQQSVIISSMHQLNCENKWLMSVSNDDIEEYIRASSKRAPAERPRVTKESIVGTWQMDIDYEKGVRRYTKLQTLTINPDNTFRIVRMADAYQTSADTIYTHTDTVCGHWRLEGNNLIRIFDSIKMAPVASYADDKQLCEYLAEYKADLESDTASIRIVMSDILIGDTEMSTMEYSEGKEDNTRLVHYRRK